MQKQEKILQKNELDDILCPKCKRIMFHWRDKEIALLFQCNCGYQEIVNLQTGIVVKNDKAV